MIPFARSWICAKCKPIFLQRLREGAPLAAVGAEVWQSGDAVVVPHGGILPTRCAKCNGAVTGKFIDHTYHSHPRWLYFLLLIPPICFFVWFMLSKRVDISVPICEECRQRRRIFIGVSVLLMVTGISCEIVAISMESAALCLLALAIVIAALLSALFRVGLVYLKRIDSQHVWLQGFCEKYRASLPEFPE